MFKEKKKKFQVDMKHIPHGTQVVTLCDRIFNDYTYKKGKTGIITGSNYKINTYKISFSDGTILEYSRNELAIRKTEIENNIQDFTPDPLSLKKYIIYDCLVGSKAFGLSHEKSDEDIRGIYLAPPELLWSLWGAPGQIEFKNEDIVYWELEKFIRLALKGNPNILETMWTPIVNHKHELANKLLEMKECFLSRHIFKTYGGYAISQFEKMKNEYNKTGKFKTKHALHLIRLLMSGTIALKKGYIQVDVSDFRNDLLAIREGKLSFEDVQRWRKELEIAFNEAYNITNLPELPDIKRINDFLIYARQWNIENKL